jgi:hypothetical protein
MVDVLIDTYIIHSHPGREREMFKVDIPKVFRHAQVDDDVLSDGGSIAGHA